MSTKERHRAVSPEIDSVATMRRLLRTLGVKATSNHVKEVLLTHPDFPSLLSFAESLPEWGVAAEGVRGEVGDLSGTDYPSIIHLRTHEFALLESVDGGRAVVFEPSRGQLEMSLQQFAGMWTGVLLRACPQNGAGERDYENHRRHEWSGKIRWALMSFGLPLLTLTLLVMALASLGMRETAVPLAMIKTVGLALCGVMTTDRLGQGALLGALCPMGAVGNCHRVMASPAGRLLGVSMAEWGLLYFAGGLLTLLITPLAGTADGSLGGLALLNLLTLPYTLFSVGYQAWAVRSWCWLCLAVQALFWLEFYVLYEPVTAHLSLSVLEAPLAPTLGFGLAVCGWVGLRSVLAKAREAESSGFEAARLNRRPEYIHWQLEQVRPVEMGRFSDEIELGAPEASTVLTLVVNPLCGHCWQTFTQLDQLLGSFEGRLRAVVRFLVAPQDPSQTAVERLLDREVALRLLALAATGDRIGLQQAISAWFRQYGGFSRGRFRRWANRYAPEAASCDGRQAELLEQHRQWAIRSQVGATPTCFLDGRRLPAGLQLGDLGIYLMRRLQS